MDPYSSSITAVLFPGFSPRVLSERAVWPYMQPSFTPNMVKYLCLVGEGGSSLFTGYRFSQEVMRETSPSCFLKVTPLEAVLKTTHTQTMALPAVREAVAYLQLKNTESESETHEFLLFLRCRSCGSPIQKNN